MGELAALLKESWTHVEERSADMVNYFYARIFLTEPGLRDLFPVDMSTQRARLLSALIRSAQLVDEPDRFAAYLRSLGKDHRKFYVTPEHYGIVGACLVATLRHYSGQHWCAEYEQAWHAVYDLMAEQMIWAASADQDPPLWHAEVLQHERRGRDVAVFTCRPLQPYAYAAGQYASLETSHQPRLWRSYSIANAPRPDNTLEFHIRATRTGWVSAALVRKLQPGDMIKLGPPMGEMTLNPGSNHDMVAIVGGTGLAPIKAMVDELSRYNRTRWVHLFFGARDRDDLYDLPALNRLAGRLPWLSVIPACSEDPGYSGERGQICEIVRLYGPWSEHDFYVCGPPSMVQATLHTLAEMGVPQVRIKYDASLPETADPITS